VAKPAAQSLTPDDLLVTHELYQRAARPADLSTELDAYRELSGLMASDPVLAIRRFLDLALADRVVRAVGSGLALTPAS
jgi:hypothetical protein